MTKREERVFIMSHVISAMVGSHDYYGLDNAYIVEVAGDIVELAQKELDNFGGEEEDDA